MLVFVTAMTGSRSGARGMATRDDVLHFTTEDLPRLCRSLGDKEVDGRWLGAIVDPEALTLVDDLKIKRKTTELGS